MLRYFLVLISGLAMCVRTATAQNQRIVDSLRNVLISQSGADRFPAVHDLTLEYVFKDNHKAIQYIEEAAKAALLSGDSLWIVKSIRVRGQLLHAVGRPKGALVEFERLITSPSLLPLAKNILK